VAYNPFVHPQFTANGRLLVSYNLNHVSDPKALLPGRRHLPSPFRSHRSDRLPGALKKPKRQPSGEKIYRVVVERAGM
jgi:hypothetical protein